MNEDGEVLEVSLMSGLGRGDVEISWSTSFVCVLVNLRGDVGVIGGSDVVFCSVLLDVERY